VSGGTGFIGGHLATALNERGFAVRILSRRASNHPFAEVVRGDLMAADTRLDEALEGCTTIFH
jgi:nucleoside-diphosphate-sugar epimerase